MNNLIFKTILALSALISFIVYAIQLHKFSENNDISRGIWAVMFLVQMYGLLNLLR